MGTSERVREQMGLPKDAEETVKMLREAFEGPESKREQRVQILKEQIDNLLESAFDTNSGLNDGQRNSLKTTAKELQDQLDGEEQKWNDLKNQLTEIGWFGEEGHTLH